MSTPQIIKNYIILEEAQYTNILEQIAAINKHIKKSEKKIDLQILDNSDIVQKFNISKRLLQKWRDENIISFSQINGKIYYKYEDVQKLIDNNYKPATKIK